MDSNKSWTCGSTWAKSLRLKIRLKKLVFRTIDLIFLVWSWERKRERKREVQDFFRRSSEFCWSEFIEPRTKVYWLDEGYVYVPKTRSFTKDPKNEIWGNQRFWAYEVFLRPSTFSTTLQDVGILPTLVLFPPFTLILGGLLCRCSKGLFGLFLDILWPFFMAILWPV